jgi:hypothetical protein
LTYGESKGFKGAANHIPSVVLSEPLCSLSPYWFADLQGIRVCALNEWIDQGSAYALRIATRRLETGFSLIHHS